jgi:hypothetical protein
VLAALLTDNRCLRIDDPPSVGIYADIRVIAPLESGVVRNAALRAGNVQSDDREWP